MPTTKELQTSAAVNVENIGGIDSTSVELQQGVNVLVGRNATNRTSFLQAVMGACGSKDVALKTDADEGNVELTLDGTTYSRSFSRQGGSIHCEGNPYLEDPTVADLFAFLLESNEARQAVMRRDDLRDIIMRPVDTEAIQAEIERLEANRDEIDGQLQEIEDARKQLPELETRRAELVDELEAKTDELETKTAELEKVDADIEESQAEKKKLNDKLDELNSLRTSLETVRSRLDTERTSLDNLEEERSTVENELDELSDIPSEKVQELESDLSRLRERKRTLETTMNQLQRIIQFNETMLEDDVREVLDVLPGESANDTGTITDGLLPGSSLVCWTCGSEVEPEAVETTLDELRDLRKGILNEMHDIDDRIDEIQAERRDLEDQRQTRDTLERRLNSLETELRETKETVADLEARREELSSDIGSLEDEVADLESESYSELVDLHKEVNRLELERDRLDDQLEEIERQIEEKERRIEDEERLRARREEIQQELVDQRTYIKQLETEAIEQFNTQMDELLEMLDFRNISRIWLERREVETRDGRRKVTETKFELHVVRESQDGASYEDTVDRLSESEREVTGIVFALAGYLAHEVYSTLPFLLLDSLEAIDSDRIATLIEYISDYAEFVIVALLPEDANALDDGYHKITEI